MTTWIKITLFLTVLISLQGCYVLQQAGPFLSHRTKAKDIQKILDDPGTDKETAAFLKQVLDIKDYAMLELGLNEDKNFTKYMEVDKDYVATVVSASKALSFETHYWNYPFLGKMPYKGFYKEAQAEKEVKKLKEKGLDVWARRVEAFSSLGYFSDPLFSYMQNYSLYRLANLIIHEQVHATVFFKNQSAFNEEVASFIGDIGGKLYIISRFGENSEQYKNIDLIKEDSKSFVNVILDLRKELEILYNKEIPDEEKILQKQLIIKKTKEDFLKNYDKLFHFKGYEGFVNVPINNAYIDLYHLYYEDNRLYEKLYEKHGSIPGMIKVLKPLEKEKEPKKILEEMVQ